MKRDETRSTADLLRDLKSRLESLETERSRILTAIAVIEGTPMTTATVLSSQSPWDPKPPRATAPYANMTITDAAIHFIRSEGSPQKTGAIARALAAGKIPSSSKNLYRMVYNSLSHRAKTKGDLKKSAGLWSLRR